MPTKSLDVAGQTPGLAEPIHPREHLTETLQELGITQYRLAKTIGVSPIRIHEIVHGRRSITADSALRIGKALGMTPDFWLTCSACTTWTSPGPRLTPALSNRLLRYLFRAIFVRQPSSTVPATD